MLGEVERIGDIIRKSRFPGRREGKATIEYLRYFWEGIAGERLARHSRPSRLRKKTLTVVADGPAWASEFSASAQSVRAAIDATLGKGVVEKIRVLSGKVDVGKSE